jgi:hypothetical protein
MCKDSDLSLGIVAVLQPYFMSLRCDSISFIILTSHINAKGNNRIDKEEAMAYFKVVTHSFGVINPS